jgi:serine/threonine-protein kinase RsbW
VRATVRLELPRDTASVTLGRCVIRSALIALGVADDVRFDLELALAEACANVVKHATDSEGYQVAIGINDGVCRIDVIDNGRGYDERTLHPSMPKPTAEAGRGLPLIRMLTEHAELAHHPNRGTIMHFEKTLRWKSPALNSRLN